MGGGTPAIPTETSIPKGIIVSWYGDKGNIPSGWSLCDGTNGTPDLRDRFLLGAGESHGVGDVGGSETVTLTVEQMPAHNHTFDNYGSLGKDSVTINSASSGTQKANILHLPISANLNNTGSSQPHNNMPPYYTLCYIMKI